MQRLTPLVIRLLVAVAAVFRGREGPGLDEVVALNGRVAGQRDVVGSELKFVGLADVVGVRLAGPVFRLGRGWLGSGRWLGAGVGALLRGLDAGPQEHGRATAQEEKEKRVPC